MRCVVTSLVISMIFLLSLAGTASAQGAPAAKITAVVVSVEHRVGATGQFTRSKVGTLLPAGSRVRTGKRSKCEIRFPDGSIIRMGPTSDMVIQGVTDKNMQLQKGTLFAKFVSGSGARIQGGSAVAAVKGTTMDYSSFENPDGTFTDGCTVYSSASGVDFETLGGTTALSAGFGASWSAGQPLGPPASNPQPPQQFGHGQYLPPWSGVGPGMSQQSTPGGDAGLNWQQSSFSIGSTVNSALPGAYGAEFGDLHVDVQSASVARERGTGIDTLAMARMPIMGAAAVTAVMGQTPVSRELLGKRFFGPYLHTNVFGVWGDGGSVAGLRVRPTAVVGDWYVEVGGTATHDFHGRWHTRLTEAFAANRSEDTEITIGRQHYLAGPVNNSGLGTVIGFDTLDAIRWQRQIDHRYHVDLALVHDYLPLGGEKIRGYVGRAQVGICGGVIGGNWVHEHSRGAGKSLDFSFPALPGKLDVYGEYGSNSDDRHVETWGIYLPGLYQTDDIDLFIERASCSGKPTVNSLVAYKQANEKVTGVFMAHKSSGGSWKVGIGGMWDF